MRELKEARRACRAALKQAKATRLLSSPPTRFRAPTSGSAGEPHKAEKWWRKSLAHAEKLGARYEGALTMLEMGRRLGDREQLERAEAAFGNMGAEHYLAQARDLLAAARQEMAVSEG